jgi:anti-sigma regulatory factor (Ser/Thr protein kinase)
MHAPPDRGRPREIAPPAPSGVSRIAWWTRDFPGGEDQVSAARHWIEELLPGCEALDDVLLLASEVCTNAVVHTLSGRAGRFSVDVEWSPSLVRVVVGDQGSLKAPAVSARDDHANWADECGRGLWLVDAMSDDWGTIGHLAGRCVWFEVGWQAKGGPLLAAPDGHVAMSRDISILRRLWPGTTVWWGHLTQAWWAALPGAAGAETLISAPTMDTLIPGIARTHQASRPTDLASLA